MQGRFGEPGQGRGPTTVARVPTWPERAPAPGVGCLPPLVLGPDGNGDTLVTARGRVLHFGPTPPQRLPGGEWIDCAGCTILPGTVDAHTHIYRAFAPLGMPEPHPAPRDYLSWLSQTWWRMDRALDRWTLTAAARLYVANSLLAGTTTLVDHHVSAGFLEGSLDVIADACAELGMRAALSYGVTERNDGREEAERGLIENERFLLSNARANVLGLVGLDASFALSDETLRFAGQLCRDMGTVLHVHLAEDEVDQRDARNRGYDCPLVRLHRFRAIPPGTILAPGLCLPDEEVQLARELRCWIVQTPRSSEQRGGHYPAALADNQRVALGTDGLAGDMRAEVTCLSQQTRRQGDDRHTVLHRTRAGRELAGELFGLDFSLREGGAADVVVASREGVRHVVIGGRLVVRDGALVAADLRSIQEEAYAMSERLWQHMR